MRAEPKSSPTALERVLAFGIFALLVFASLVITTVPLRDALTQRADLAQRLHDHRLALAEPQDQASFYDPAALAGGHADDASAQLELQSIVDRHARDAGFSLQSVAPLGAEALGDFGRTIWIEASMTGDVQALTDFLARLDAETPVVLMRSLDINAPDRVNSDRALIIRAEIGRAWRLEGQSQ